MKTKLTYGSLFSGVGGFDMGFDQEGYECVFQVEWDKHCQKILAKHWPQVPKWSDVQDVNGAEIPPCDVLTFGSPCQDLSVAGKRAGLDGTKSSMFYEATRIIKEMRNATGSVYPRVVVWENVPGALSSNNGADFGAVIDTLADIGAVDIHWSVLDAQHFGVPQRRRRIFVVAIFDPATSERCPDPLLPVIKSSRGDFAKGRKAQQNAARSTEAGIDAGGQWWDGEKTADCLTTTSNEQRMPDKNRLQAVIQSPFIIDRASFTQGVNAQYDPIIEQREIMPTLISAGPHAVGQPMLTEPQPPYVFDGTRHDDFRMDTETVPTLKQRMGTGGGQVPMLAEPVVYDGYNQKLDDTGIHRTLRSSRDGSDFVAQPTYSFDTQFGSNAAVFENQSPTLKATQQSPSVTMPGLAVRRLTPLECERLMGWPDDHTRWNADGTEQADTHRYRQCGNGVATPVAKWIAKHLKNILITNDNE